MRIDDTGNIGIGTNDPTSLLDVEGNVQFVGDIYLGNYDGGANENTSYNIRSYGEMLLSVAEAENSTVNSGLSF